MNARVAIHFTTGEHAKGDLLESGSEGYALGDAKLYDSEGYAIAQGDMFIPRHSVKYAVDITSKD